MAIAKRTQQANAVAAGNIAAGSAQFPERYFATCREAKGYRFRTYGKTPEECLTKAKKANSANIQVYDAILRMRVR